MRVLACGSDSGLVALLATLLLLVIMAIIPSATQAQQGGGSGGLFPKTSRAKIQKTKSPKKVDATSGGQVINSQVTEPKLVADCKSGSPIASTFSKVTNVVQVSDSTALNKALAAITQPTIIQLNTSGTYTLSQLYYVNQDLCIQVRSQGHLPRATIPP